MGGRKVSYARIVITLVAAIAAILCIDYLRRNFTSISESENSEPFAESYSLIETTSANPDDDVQDYIPEVHIDMDMYVPVEMSYENVSKGELALVSKSHKSTFPDIEDELITFPYRTERTYRVTDYFELKLYESAVEAIENMLGDFYNETDCHDVTISSGYRNEEKQNELIQTGYTKDEAGSSEHHTGYAFDFKVVTDDMKISNLENKDIFSWIYENCYRYGIVQRYTEDKAYVTDMLARSYHFRYVGIPHAYYMHENNLCLEEYIELLQDYSFDKKHLEINTGRSLYEVYYVKAQEGTTSVYVPKNSEYSVSGNNIDGFIVTVLKSNNVSSGAVTSVSDEVSAVEESEIINSDDASGETVVNSDN